MFAPSSTETCLITDPGIPTLAKAFDPVVLGVCLPEVLPSEWGMIRDVRLQVLKHHPGKRCTFEITLGTTIGCHSLIGKVYAADRSDIYESMDKIRRAGFGEGQEFSIPRPLGYLPELRLLLQEKVEGIRAKAIFLEGSDRDRTVTAERCARWLAQFHAKAPKAGPVFEITEHLASMERWSCRTAEGAGASAGKAARLFDRLQLAASRLSSVEMCAGHGSYNHAQIILTKDRTITFDWDSYDVADPCRDVARFIVDLQRLALKHLGSMRTLNAAGEVFLKTYVAAGRSDVLTRLAFQKAAIYLDHAKHDVHKQVPGWPERVEATLDEGLRVLGEGVEVE